jgi:hypothetical protein
MALFWADSMQTASELHKARCIHIRGSARRIRNLTILLLINATEIVSFNYSSNIIVIYFQLCWKMTLTICMLFWSDEYWSPEVKGVPKVVMVSVWNQLCTY